MGMELRGFLGAVAGLRKWRLASAVVCPLAGELAFVPLTAALWRDLRARLDPGEAERLDVDRRNAWPPPSFEEAARRWAAEASAQMPLAYVDLFEFGNMGHERATLWRDGRVVIDAGRLSDAVAYLRDQVHLDVGSAPIDLEKYRGETAAEKWAASVGPPAEKRGLE